MRARFRASLPKDGGAGTNEDFFSCSERNQVFAVSDGASISFDSASWAKILVRRFAQQPLLNRDWVSSAAVEFSNLYAPDTLAWNLQAAYERGSFATLLGVRVDSLDQSVHVTAVGDSIAILLDGEKVVQSFPLDSADQFGTEPMLLSTRDGKNEFLASWEAEGRISRSWSLEGLKAPEVLCMTDALGAWCLAGIGDEQSSISRLRALKRSRDLRTLVLEENAAGRMRRDDVSLIRLG